jgi:hypothetical protein
VLAASIIMSTVAGYSFRSEELRARRDSLFNITAIAQMEQANVLDSLDDAVIIADPSQASYINE